MLTRNHDYLSNETRDTSQCLSEQWRLKSNLFTDRISRCLAGPFALPIVGNALAILYWGPKIAFQKFVKGYGGILTVRIFDEW